jgi:integrase
MAETDRGRVARLTKREVDAAQPTGKRFVVWDSELKGFGLRVEPGGGKTFFVRYRIGGGRNGRLRQFTIGAYRPLTPEQGRCEAERVLASVKLGQDPQAARAADRATLTVSSLCDLYLDEGTSVKRGSTLALDRIRIEGFIKKRLGSRRVTEVTRGDVERLMNDIAAERFRKPLNEEERRLLKQSRTDDGRRAGLTLPTGRRVRGGRTAATKTVKLLRAIYKFAQAYQPDPLCSSNPTQGVKTFPDVERERFLSAAELGRLGEVLQGLEALKPSHVAAARLLVLTGARKNEIVRLRWSEVRDQGAWLQLENTKTGRKAIKLGAPAQEVLASVERAASPYVFPDRVDPSKPIRNFDWFWVGVREAAGLPNVRVHDLRHSFASEAVGAGQSLYLVSKLLGHARITTTQRYAHLADDPIKAAADAVSTTISGALAGRSADVRQLPRAR